MILPNNEPNSGNTPAIPEGTTPTVVPDAPPNIPPPAATIVAVAPISESSVQAQRELEKVNQQLRETQLRASKLEDENKLLKSIPANPIDETAKKQKKGFLDGWRPLID